jgi:hypothetical protein
MFIDNIDALEAAISPVMGSIRTSVADIDALAGINTTSIPDGMLILVRYVGIYRFDKYSMAPGDYGITVQPNAGGGRWILIADIDTARVIRYGVSNTMDLSWGYNFIKNLGNPSAFPSTTITGRHYINLLGRDGNCEDINKWNTSNTTISLDSDNKVFGSNAIKVVLTGTYGTFNKEMLPLLSSSKCYIVTAYIKNGNTSASNIGVYTNGAGFVTKYSPTVTDTTKFTRVLTRIQPSEWGTDATSIIVLACLSGQSGQYAYVDGIQINEVSVDEYNNLSDADLMIKYPYVDSYACLTNPYFENRRYNLAQNGNCEEGISHWVNSGLGTGVLSIENGKFKLVSSNAYAIFAQPIQLKANTTYYLSGNSSGATFIRILNTACNAVIKDGPGIFTTDSVTTYMVAIENPAAGTGTADSIMLVEGAVAPTTYRPCDVRRFAVEGMFTDDDTITIKDGIVSGLLSWKHRTLFGKDYDWKYNQNYTGFKRINLVGTSDMRMYPNNQTPNDIAVKYDGSILKYDINVNAVGDSFCGKDSGGKIWLTILDSDSGWSEDVAPNDNEVKVYMNGWRAKARNGDRYVFWYSIVDGSMPGGAINTPITIAANIGSTTVTVQDGTKFKVNDFVDFYDPITRDLSGNYYITGISGNVLTLNTGLTKDVATSYYCVRCDNGTTVLSLLGWCKNNIAPAYEGYRLHYKLTNPEPVTDSSAHINGEIWQIVCGDNYITVDTGMVLDEVVNPQITLSNFYCINTVDTFGTHYGMIRYPAEQMLGVYKNRVSDPVWITDSNMSVIWKGKSRMYCTQADYDINATYTVDYQILRTIAPQVAGDISVKYSQSILDAIFGINDEVGQKQPHDGVLDNIVDASMYEKVSSCGYTVWGYDSSSYNIDIYFNFKVMKRTIPIITLGAVTMMVLGIDVTRHFNVTYIGFTRAQGIVRYTVSDPTVVSNIRNYGIYAQSSVTADCKGRV